MSKESHENRKTMKCQIQVQLRKRLKNVTIIHHMTRQNFFFYRLGFDAVEAQTVGGATNLYLNRGSYQQTIRVRLARSRLS